MKKQRERSKDEIPFREMTPAQKRSYLWDYWRLPALAVVIVAVSLIALINTMISSKDVLLSVTTVDAGDDTDFTALAEQFAEENGIPRDQLAVGNMVVGSSQTGGATYSQAGTALYVRMQAGSEDVVILPEVTFTEFASSGYFLDLTDVVPKEWQDSLVIVQQRYDEYENVQPDPIPFGIRIRDISGMADTPYNRDAVIAIVVNADHTETAIAFLNSLLKK